MVQRLRLVQRPTPTPPTFSCWTASTSSVHLHRYLGLDFRNGPRSGGTIGKEDVTLLTEAPLIPAGKGSRMELTRELRFAVGARSGRQAGIWRIWTRPSGDVYLTLRLPARHFKISLHRSGRWRLAYTGVLAGKEEALGRDRAPVKWNRPRSNPDGTTTALEIRVPASEVVTPPQPGSDDSRILWREPPALGLMYVFRLRLASSGVDLSRSGVLGPLDAGDEWVWIETFERRQSLAQHEHLEAFKRKMAERDAGTFPTAGPLEARILFLAPDGSYVIDAVLPDV